MMIMLTRIIIILLLLIIIIINNTNTNNHNCDDHSLLDFKSAVQYIKHFIYHFTIIIVIITMTNIVKFE